MNGESEALQRSFLKLLQELIPNASPADAEAIRQGLESEMSPLMSGDVLGSDSIAPQEQPLGADEMSISISASCDSEAFSVQRKSSHELGELPAVQDRFHALLKRRLKTEIQLNPPLFPWETEIYDYETSEVGFTPRAAMASEPALVLAADKAPAGLWLSQLRAFNLPVALPDAVLQQLFRRCQAAARSSLREGAKLVHAVEELFPGRDSTLNYLAGLVLTAPARSPATAPVDTHLLETYETAEPAQQMVLSLLAAREILSALTLTALPHQTVERQWVTDLGLLTLRVHYEVGEPNWLRVEGILPTGGKLVLRGQTTQAIAQRSDAGALGVELAEATAKADHELEVQLAGTTEPPVVFMIKLG
jgi:hypothetical protein